MAIITRALYLFHSALYDRSPTARCREQDSVKTYISKDRISNFLVLGKHIVVVQGSSLKVRDDGQSLNLLISINKISDVNTIYFSPTEEIPVPQNCPTRERDRLCTEWTEDHAMTSRIVCKSSHSRSTIHETNMFP
jgi:hypothetical protein